MSDGPWTVWEDAFERLFPGGDNEFCFQVVRASEVEQYREALRNLYDAWKDGTDTSLAVARAHELLHAGKKDVRE